jgi:hypothetical protein
MESIEHTAESAAELGKTPEIYLHQATRQLRSPSPMLCKRIMPEANSATFCSARLHAVLLEKCNEGRTGLQRLPWPTRRRVVGAQSNAVSGREFCSGRRINKYRYASEFLASYIYGGK